jgi:starch synthase
VHNLGYQGVFPRASLARIGLPESLFRVDALEYYGKINFMKGGLIFSDYLSTVSQRYAQEIQTAEYGVGLEGVIQGRADRLAGILNGVDYTVWSPELDTHIAAKYSAHDLSGKKTCKKDLLAAFKLPAESLERPLLGIVSRFADQKGFDLIAEMATDLLKENLSIVILGSGDAKYEKFFQALAGQYPQQVGVKVAYDNALAHKIEAGSDMFLMPSRYEPCGLNQIYSLRYGTVPVVRATGGLDDTIVEFDPARGQGTGFKFDPYTGKAMLQTVRQALRVFGDRRAWQTLQANAMAKDFSWKSSATAYVALYEAATRSRIPRAANTSN